MKDYFVLASKNLKNRGIRSWLTLLGICIGIAAVVALISLGSTLKETVNAQFNIATVEVISVQAGGINGFGPPGSGVSNPLTKQDASAIEKLGLVEFAIPRNIKTLQVEYNNKVSFITAGSLPSDQKIKDVYEITDLEIDSGRLLESGDNKVVMVGGNLADGAKNGFDKSLTVGSKVILNGEDFRVIGILKNKGSFITDNTIYITENALKSITNIGDEVSLIVVKPKDSSQIEQTKVDIEKLLRERRNVKVGEEDFEVSTPEASLQGINQILTGIQIFIVIIASISIFIGAVGIANTMTTSVIERRREIGIMKSIGARNKNIFYQFFVEAGLLGLMGGLIGVIFGMGIGYLGTFTLNSFLGTETSPSIDLILIFSALIGSFVIGSLSGIIPAMNAARENPVEAMRR